MYHAIRYRWHLYHTTQMNMNGPWKLSQPQCVELKHAVYIEICSHLVTHSISKHFITEHSAGAQQENTEVNICYLYHCIYQWMSAKWTDDKIR